MWPVSRIWPVAVCSRLVMEKNDLRASRPQVGCKSAAGWEGSLGWRIAGRLQAGCKWAAGWLQIPCMLRASWVQGDCRSLQVQLQVAARRLQVGYKSAAGRTQCECKAIAGRLQSDAPPICKAIASRLRTRRKARRATGHIAFRFWALHTTTISLDDEAKSLPLKKIT